MTPVLIFLGIVAFLVGWNFFMVKLSGRPWWNPLWMAFTITAVGLMNAVAGAVGYELPRHNPFITPGTWAGHVVWSQIGFGCAICLVAVFFWRKGLQRL